MFEALFHKLSPELLSGMVDIIVVKQPDGSLKSSRFHIQFGKSDILLPAGHLVKIHINGEENQQVAMLLDSYGRAFFPSADGKESIIPSNDTL
jgi:phosphatidate phosphatase LPIN